MKKLPPAKVLDAKNQLQQGKSCRKVADSLKISLASVLRIRSEDKENIPELCPGRPRLISQTTCSAMARNYDAGLLKTYKDGQRFVQAAQGKQIHINTIRDNLLRMGIRTYSQPKKPKLSLAHKAQRLEFAKKHIHWTVEDWKRVMFSDETIISRCGSFGKSYYHSRPHMRRLQPHQVRQTMQGGGGKMMIWGCITFFGPGDASWIQGKVDSDSYLDVVRDYVRQSRDWWGMDQETFIFQQDNASVHTARKVIDFFEENNITILAWPPHSPDLNPIEHVWAYMKKELDRYPEAPKTLNELWDRVQAIWVKMPTTFLHTLYESMPSRLEEVIKNKGGNTKY
jgi:transposase